LVEAWARTAEALATAPAALDRGGAGIAASALLGTAGSFTRCACFPSTWMTVPACAGAATAAVIATAARAVRLTYPI
jgi:hypothetical protein